MENEFLIALGGTAASFSALGIMVYSTFIRKPPLDWFEGSEDTNGDLKIVGPSDKFMHKWYSRVGKYYDDYRHLSGNRVDTEGSSEKERKDAAKKIKVAKIMLQLLTGFSAERIENRRHELRNEYKYSSVRPFRVIR